MAIPMGKENQNSLIAGPKKDRYIQYITRYKTKIRRLNINRKAYVHIYRQILHH